MVDPLEAKRLAGKQMEEIKGREKQQVRKKPFGGMMILVIKIGRNST